MLNSFLFVFNSNAAYFARFCILISREKVEEQRKKKARLLGKILFL
jgi:hypothetical protein